MIQATPAPYKAADGTPLHVQYWRPETVRAVVIQVHGLGEHCGRYQHVADAFAAEGFALLAFDHTGHGKSGGGRGHVPGYGRLLEELDLALAKSNILFPGAPIFLYGHSWGGNITLNYLLRRKPNVKAAIVTGPWLKLPKEPPAFQVFLGRMVKGIFPAFSQKTNLDANLLSHDPALNEAYRKDPLVHGKISALNYFDSADAAVWALKHASSLAYPTLLMHGAEDGITSPTGTKEFAAKAHGIKLKIWDGMYHEIHNEVGKEAVLREMLDFLKGQLQGS